MELYASEMKGPGCFAVRLLDLGPIVCSFAALLLIGGLYVGLTCMYVHVYIYMYTKMYVCMPVLWSRTPYTFFTRSSGRQDSPRSRRSQAGSRVSPGKSSLRGAQIMSSSLIAGVCTGYIVHFYPN